MKLLTNEVEIMNKCEKLGVSHIVEYNEEFDHYYCLRCGETFHCGMFGGGCNDNKKIMRIMDENTELHKFREEATKEIFELRAKNRELQDFRKWAEPRMTEDFLSKFEAMGL